MRTFDLEHGAGKQGQAMHAQPIFVWLLHKSTPCAPCATLRCLFHGIFVLRYFFCVCMHSHTRCRRILCTCLFIFLAHLLVLLQPFLLIPLLRVFLLMVSLLHRIWLPQRVLFQTPCYYRGQYTIRLMPLHILLLLLMRTSSSSSL